MSDNHIEHIILRGDPFTRGQIYGEKCRQKIVSNLEYHTSRYTCLDWSAVQKFITDNYVKALKKYYPSALTEMEGIAKGANITLMDVLIINSRYELMRWNKMLLQKKENRDHKLESDGCTSGVCLSGATKSGNILMGQNWDNNKRILTDDMMVFLEIYPDVSENIPALFTLTEVGQLARIGMNTNGLGITGMSLFSSEDNFGIDGTNGYVPVSLLRRLYLESPSYSVGLKRIITAPRHASVNMTAVCGQEEGEAVNIEMTPKNAFISHPSMLTDVYSHSNQFKSVEFVANTQLRDTYCDGSSQYRDRRLERILTKKTGTIDNIVFEEAFKDHFGYPDSICYHSPPEGRKDMVTYPNMCTVASIICDLTNKTVRLCKGQPCVGQFKDFTFNKDYLLPVALEGEKEGSHTLGKQPAS